jgi:outer membrane protein TolC
MPMIPEMKYSTDRANWTAGLYLNWKIFDGFATKSDRAEALSHLQETMAADRKTLLAVKFDVKKAYLNLNEAQERLKVATSNVQTAGRPTSWSNANMRADRWASPATWKPNWLQPSQNA